MKKTCLTKLQRSCQYPQGEIMSKEFRIWADSFRNKPFTVNGNEIELVAIQESRRTNRKGKTNYVYHVLNENTIMVNFSLHHPFWMKIAPDSEMSEFYKLFMNRPTTPDDKKWLERNNYELI